MGPLTTPQAIVIAAIILAVGWIIGKIIERKRSPIAQSIPNSTWPEGGAPIQPTGQLVTESTYLEPGRTVQVEWEGSWWAGKVLCTASNGEVKIHYVGWDDSWDEYVPRTRLRLGVD